MRDGGGQVPRDVAAAAADVLGTPWSGRTLAYQW